MIAVLNNFSKPFYRLSLKFIKILVIKVVFVDFLENMSFNILQRFVLDDNLLFINQGL